MEKLLQTIRKNKEIEIIGIAHDLAMFLRKVLPITFRPDLVIMDFQLYQQYYTFLEPLRNNCRKLAILGDHSEEEVSLALRNRFKKQFYFIVGPNINIDLSNCITLIMDALVEESKFGHFYLENNWGSATLTYGEEFSFEFANLIFVRYTSAFTLFHLSNTTYISSFQLKNFKYLLQKKWMLKVSKTMVLNLKKIHKIDLLNSKVTMVNGVSVEFDEVNLVRFVQYIKKNLRLSMENKAVIEKFEMKKDRSQ